MIGWQPPTWISTREVSFNLGLASFDTSQPCTGINLSLEWPRLANRVPLDSPFLDSCTKGDVKLMRQLLADGQGALSDRDIDFGMTPLIVSIQVS